MAKLSTATALYAHELAQHLLAGPNKPVHFVGEKGPAPASYARPEVQLIELIDGFDEAAEIIALRCSCADCAGHSPSLPPLN